MIDVNRRAAMKAKQEVDKLEPKKEQQDILVERSVISNKSIS